MSQAEKLLDSLTVDDISTYTTEPETEGHIVIGADRFITVPESLKRIAVQTDHNIETVTFDCPRYWDGHDLSTMQIYINFMRPDKEQGSYIVENVIVDSSDSNLIHFDWTIAGDVTAVNGMLRFLVCGKTIDADGITTLHWNSELNSDMYISEGMDCENMIVEQSPAIITQLLTRMDEVEAIAITKDQMDTLVSETLVGVAEAKSAAVTAKDVAEDVSVIFDKFEGTPASSNRLYEMVNGTLNPNTGLVGYSPNEITYYSNFIPVTPGEIITVQMNDGFQNGTRVIAKMLNVAAYDENETFISGSGASDVSSYTVPNGASYILCHFDTVYNYEGTDVAIVASETVIPYDEYREATYEELKPENIISTTSKLANAIKGTASGQTVRINDISPATHNIDVKVTTKNLVPYTNDYANGTRATDGITFTRQDDGTTIANGTATSTAYFLMQQGTDYSSQIPIGKGVYTLSTAPAAGCRIAIGVRESSDVDRTLISATSSTPMTFDVTSDTARFDVILCVDVGFTVENVVFKPQLERGDAMTEYVPYVDLSEVTVHTTGRNLMPYPYVEMDRTRAGITWSISDDGKITVNGTSTGSYLELMQVAKERLYLHKDTSYYAE